MGAKTLALALARNARHAGNRARFDQALGILMPQRDHEAELRNALAYEECLWDLAAGDLTSLLTRLDSWIPAHGETLWSLRKAGLLAEMQEHVIVSKNFLMPATSSDRLINQRLRLLTIFSGIRPTRPVRYPSVWDR
jgi:hypothetical protein